MQSDGKTKDLLRRFFHVLVVSFSFLGTFLEPVLDTEDPKNQQTFCDLPSFNNDNGSPNEHSTEKKKKNRNCISLEEKKGGNREEGRQEKVINSPDPPSQQNSRGGGQTTTDP